MLPNATKNWLQMDVLLSTMPFSTLQHMAQFALGIYQKPPATSNSSKIFPPDIIVISNVFDHLAIRASSIKLQTWMTHNRLTTSLTKSVISKTN